MDCVLGHTGYQLIITILVISNTPSLYANLRVATRVYDVEGGAIFSKNSTFVFFDGAAWTPRLRSPSPDYGFLLLSLAFKKMRRSQEGHRAECLDIVNYS